MAGGSGVGESQCLVRVRQHWIEESKCRSHWEHDLGEREGRHRESQCHGHHGTARHPEQWAGHYCVPLAERGSHQPHCPELQCPEPIPAPVPWALQHPMPREQS